VSVWERILSRIVVGNRHALGSPSSLSVKVRMATDDNPSFGCVIARCLHVCKGNKTVWPTDTITCLLG
jgi:hypothetical protein